LFVPVTHAIVLAAVSSGRGRAGSCSEISSATAPGPAVCPALEVSGTIDPDPATLDPAFDVVVPAARLARPEPDGNATLLGYNAAGQLVVNFRFSAHGSYSLDISLPPAAEESIRVLRVVTATGNATRTGTDHGEPTAEPISTDDSDIVFAWNAQIFPAIKIMPVGDPNTTEASGASSYNEVTVATKSHYLNVNFSDGVRSEIRSLEVFGR
jgi:hypothetical protein